MIHGFQGSYFNDSNIKGAIMPIKARHPVREEFAACSTSNRYYDTKGDAIDTFDIALQEYGYRLDDVDIVDMSGDEGRVHWAVCIDSLDYGEVVGQAVFSWYRVPSGRWEVIGYLA